jgi:hypothetical protein
MSTAHDEHGSQRRRARRRDRSRTSDGGARRRGRRPARTDTPPPTRASRWRDPQVQLAVTATVLVIGIAAVGLGPSSVGAGLTLFGAVGFFYAIHRYGRLGVEGEPPR